MKENNNHPYYDRPSIRTSYQIAVVSIMILILLVLGIGILEIVEKVSAKENDFDNTSIHLKDDIDREMFIKREFQLDGLNVHTNLYFDELTSITSDERATSEQGITE